MKPKYIQFLEKFWVKRVFSKNDCDSFFWYDSKNIITKYKNDWYIIVIKKGLFFIKNYSNNEFIDVSPFFFIDTIWNWNGYISHGTALEYYWINEQFFNWNVVSLYEKYSNKNIELAWYEYVLTPSSLDNDLWVTFINMDNKNIRITNIERTILDCFSKPELCGWINNIAKAFYEANDEWIINYKKLYKYLLEYQNKIKLSKIIGFFIDIFDIKIEDNIYNNIYIIAHNSNYIKMNNDINKDRAIYNTKFKIIIDKYDNFNSLIKY